jgi:hypothetical protein
MVLSVGVSEEPAAVIVMATLKMEAVGFTETALPVYQTTFSDPRKW